MRPRWRPSVLGILSVALCSALPNDGRAGFLNFETGHVRPLALTPDGATVVAVNTPYARLSVFRATPDGLLLHDEVPVGLEPVAVATRRNARGNVEAWVVDHLSDDVSVVELFTFLPARVTRILHVGDEPRDIVIAGHDTERVFVTTAHRGQRRPADPRLTTPGVPRADVWAFDAENPGPPDGGTPLTIVELFGDTPRALARSADGRTVYAAVFNSGNGTTTLPSWVVTTNGGLPPPPADSRWFPDRFPAVGLIVKVDAAGRWHDELGRDWSAFVPFSLPDYDVFAIDADAPVPAETGTPVTGVGTTLFNMAVRPDTGAVWVTNLEARNHVRFEPVLQGHTVDNRVTVIADGRASPVDLNPHIDRQGPPGNPAVIEQSLALPTALAFSADGRHAFLAAFGSAKVARVETAALTAGTVAGERIPVGAGPSGLAFDAATDRLYVMNQLDHTISIVADANGAVPRVVATVPVGYDPTPEVIRRGRPFLYDARLSSAYGDAACASCHIFGDTDHLAWDLGDPYGRKAPNRNKPVRGVADGFEIRRFQPFHPMKGPMFTQSLRGLAGAGPMHWRGDRTGADVGRPSDERAAFMRFNQTFVDLLGRARPLKKREMRRFTEFILTLRYPPNPVAPFNGADPFGFGPRAQEARSFFHGQALSPAGTCGTCHVEVGEPADRDRSANPTIAEPQQFKVPQLRNLYQKVGMFGVAANPFGVPAATVGPQVRGFGFLHDGSVSTLATFLAAADFEFPSDEVRRNMEQLLLEIPTELGATVGLRRVFFREDFLTDASVRQCRFVLHAVIGGRRRGLVESLPPQGGAHFDPDYLLDSRSDPPFEDRQAVLDAASGPVIFTCAPYSIAGRLSIDRDEDDIWDGDEAGAAAAPASR